MAAFPSLSELTAGIDSGDVREFAAELSGSGADPDVATVARALRLAAPTLTKRPHELRSQLVGRLGSHPTPRVHRLLEECRVMPGAWLEPLRATLIAPGGGLQDTFAEWKHWPRPLAVTPGARWLIVGSGDGLVTVMDLNRRRTHYEWRAHADGVLTALVTSDGSSLITASGDKTIKVWNLHSFQLRHHFLRPTAEVDRGESRDLVHDSWITSLALSPDEKTLASGSADGVIRLWDMRSKECVLSITGLANEPRCLVITPDGECLITNDSRLLRIWNLLPARALRTSVECNVPVTSLAMTIDGARLFAGTEDGTLEVWRAGAWQHIAAIRAHKRAITSLVLAENAKTIVSCSEDATLRLWDLDTYAPGHVFVGHSGPITRAILLNGGHSVASGSGDRTVKLWELAKPSLAEVGQCSGAIRWLTCLAAGQVMAATEDGELLAWDTASWRDVSRFHAACKRIHCLIPFAEGNLVAVGDEEGSLAIWTVCPPKLLREMRGHDTRIQAIAETQTGKCLLTGSLDGLLVAWDGRDGAEIFRLQLKEPAEHIFTTGDGSEAYCYCRDGILRVVDLKKRLLVAKDKLAKPFSSVPLYYDSFRSLLIGGRPDGTTFSWSREARVTNGATVTKAMATAITRGKETHEFLLSFSDGMCCVCDILTMSVKMTCKIGHVLTCLVVDLRMNALFAIDLDGVLRAYSLADFTELATMAGDAPFTALQIISAGMAVVADKLGRLHLVHLRSEN